MWQESRHQREGFAYGARCLIGDDKNVKQVVFDHMYVLIDKNATEDRPSKTVQW